MLLILNGEYNSIRSPFKARSTLMQWNLNYWWPLLCKSTEYIQLVEYEQTIAAWNVHFIGAYSKFGLVTYLLLPLEERCWRLSKRWISSDNPRIIAEEGSKSPELIKTTLVGIINCPVQLSLFPHWWNHTRLCQLQICETLAVCTTMYKAASRQVIHHC